MFFRISQKHGLVMTHDLQSDHTTTSTYVWRAGEWPHRLTRFRSCIFQAVCELCIGFLWFGSAYIFVEVSRSCFFVCLYFSLGVYLFNLPKIASFNFQGTTISYLGKGNCSSTQKCLFKRGYILPVSSQEGTTNPKQSMWLVYFPTLAIKINHSCR